jgi:hypothetical protein
MTHRNGPNSHTPLGQEALPHLQFQQTLRQKQGHGFGLSTESMLSFGHYYLQLPYFHILLTIIVVTVDSCQPQRLQRILVCHGETEKWKTFFADQVSIILYFQI